MADSKITGLTELSAAPSAGDLLLLVDVSDTTMAATGTNKKVDASYFVKQTAGTITQQTYITNASYPVLLTERTTAVTNSVFSVMGIMTTSSGNMVDGFGPQLIFSIRDDAAVTNNIAGIRAGRSGSDTSGILQFVTGGISTVRATIDTNGNLGIGTVSPTYKLDVVGTARISTGVISPQYYGSISSAGSALLSSTLHATKGKIYLGVNAAFDELNTRLGVGTISPARGLHVHGASDSYVRVSSNTFTSGMDFGFDGTHAYFWNYHNNDIIFATNNAERMRITSAGNITTSGTITCVDLVETSSKEEKENFSQVTGVLDKLSQVKAYYYNDKKDTENTKQTKIGLIAEDFQEFFPEMVAPVEVTEKGKTRQTKGLKYTRLVTLAIQGINELTEIQKRILDRLDNLEQKSYNLKELENGTNYA